VSSIGYSAALDAVVEASPRELIGLIRAAAAPIGAEEIFVYLADFQGVVLQPVLLSPDLSDPIFGEEEVATSIAGRVFRTGEVVTLERGGGVRVWVPLVERGERTGTVALTLPSVDDQLLAECVRLGRFAGLLARAFSRATDELHLRRRSRSMSLAAGMQWDLLPPLTVRCAQAVACGRLEPAYEIAGDAFDYALNYDHLHAALFDGMGHGVEATLMTTLAIGAYRHARRAGEDLAAGHLAIDEAVGAQYQGEAFVTGVIARLALETGVLEWTNAGHPLPLLLRGHRVVRQLSCPPSLPFGLGLPPAQVATESLEPGDSVLFFTDGMVEGRSPAGDNFGVERLADMWAQQSTSDQPPEEILRRLLVAVVDYNGGKLRDDATLMQLCWNGPELSRLHRQPATP
jgi:serine phosphatase RsbU (regulator of sigma subunit)